MWDFVGILGFLATGICLVGLSVSAVKRNPSWRKWLAGAGVAFVLFVVGAVNASPAEIQTSKAPTKQEDKISRQQDQSSKQSDKSIQTENTVATNSQVQQKQTTRQSNEASPISVEAASVLRVVDGDTIEVSYHGTVEKVRFIGIDTPESTIRHEPYGQEASDFTKSKLTGKTVYLEKDVSERDKYGRLLRYVWLEVPKSLSESEIRTKMFNAILLLQGYAQVATYPPDVKYVDYFLKFQREARQKEIGLWGLNITPSQTTSVSQGSSDRAEAVYIGNANTKKFHRPDCVWATKISSSNRVEFKTRQEAINQGYVPCKVCNP